MKVFNCDLDKIEQNENSRVVYKEADLADLMGSMKRDGLLQPVGVRKLPNGKWDLIYGNRRVLAALKLGWGEIPAVEMTAETDTDRDILNLIENMKRKNTTVAEDGRMFQVLIDRGLSVAEIAARLDVAKTRIETALEVLTDIPKEYHKVIVNKVNQTVPRGERIPATTAAAILNIRRQHNLTRKQTRALLDRAKSGASITEIVNVAPYLERGTTFARAMERAAQLKHITLELYVDRKELEKIEAREGESIHNYLIGVLQGHADCRITPRFKGAEPERKAPERKVMVRRGGGSAA